MQGTRFLVSIGPSERDATRHSGAASNNLPHIVDASGVKKGIGCLHARIVSACLTRKTSQQSDFRQHMLAIPELIPNLVVQDLAVVETFRAVTAVDTTNIE